MHEHPRREAGRRVRHPVAHVLRPRRQHREVGPASGPDARGELFECRAFFLGQAVRRGPAGGERSGDLARHGRRQVDVDSEQSRRRVSPHRFGDDRPPITALGDIARIPQPVHQLRPGSRDAVGVPPRRGRLRREAETGHRRKHQIERILGAPAMRRRVRERTDGLQQFDDRAGPAVRHDQRQRVGVGRANVDEVDVETIEARHELRQAVQLRLEPPPVIFGAPVPHEFLELRERRSLGSVINRLSVGPARRGDASTQLVDLRLRDLDAERPDCCGTGWLLACGRHAPLLARRRRQA